MAIIIDKKVGFVWVTDFDLGMVTTIGSDLGLYFDKTDPEVPCYALNIPGLDVNPVRIFMGEPDVVFVHKKFPAIVITRNSFDEDLSRWMGVVQTDYIAGVSGTEMVIDGVSGFGSYETKPSATPYNLSYTITCYSYLERQVQLILSKVLKQFSPGCKIFVKDSIGLNRSYDAWVEGGVIPQHEIVDASRRVKGYSFDVTVQGELDLGDLSIFGSVSGIELNLHKF